MKDKIKAYNKLKYKVRLVVGKGSKDFFKNLNETIY